MYVINYNSNKTGTLNLGGLTVTMKYDIDQQERIGNTNVSGVDDD